MSIESIEVVALQPGSESIIARWHERGPGVTGDEWKQLSLELTQRTLTHGHLQADLFLCLRGDYLAAHFEYQFCQTLSQFARKYGWGSRLYIAADERIDLHSDQFSNLPSLVVWLDRISQTGDRPTDLVLANFDRFRESDEFIGTYLRRACIDSRKRFDLVPDLIAPHKWYCWAASTIYTDWLKDLTQQDASNIIAVLRDDRRQTIARCEEKIASLPGRRFAIAYVGKKQISPDRIVELAKRHHLPFLMFRGLLELRYFLLRLNRLALPSTEALSQTVEITQTQNRVFSARPGQRPRLLITSFFNSVGTINLLDGAEDAAHISRRVYERAECLIHAAVRQTDLPMIVSQVHELTAWVLLAHGDEAGIKDHNGDNIDFEDFFARLASQQLRLPLVFISACRSTRAARKFAEAGAGVAIGFENDILPEICRTMAVPVVNAAIHSHGCQKAILQAFNHTCRELEQSGLRIFNPKAFYST